MVVGLCGAGAVVVGFCVTVARYLCSGFWVARFLWGVVAVGFGDFIFIIFYLIDRTC